MALKQDELDIIIGNLRRLSETRMETQIETSPKPTKILHWRDKEDFTNDVEPFKNLDALSSFVIAFESMGEELSNCKKGLKEDDPLNKILSSLNNDLVDVFGFINTNGFCPLPYLWQKPSRSFDLLDMAALVCEVCTSLLSNSYHKLGNSLINTTKTILKKSLTTIKDAAVKQPSGQYAWAGWWNIKKTKSAKFANIKASTYFTSLCCKALTKYLSAWDTKPDILGMDFDRHDLIEHIIGGINWVSTRFGNNKDGTSFFYKYDTNNEMAPYWAIFYLITISDARTLIETAGLDQSKVNDLFEKSEQLWKAIVDATAQNINNGRDLFESTTMQIDTPDAPSFYEDSVCLGGLTLALFKYSKEFDPLNDSKDFVFDYLDSKLVDELKLKPDPTKNPSDLIANNHYNLRGYFELLNYRRGSKLNVEYKTMKKLIKEIIDLKVDEMKSLIYSRLKQFENRD